MTESMSESLQAGLILATARNERQLSIEQVANELHLRPTVVRSMEEEKYSDFNSDVFLKGYFRSYCRLLKLDEEKMMSLLEGQLERLKATDIEAQEQASKSRASLKRRKLLVTFFVFVVCMGLIALTYYFASGSASQKSLGDLLNISNDKPSEPVSDDKVIAIPATKKLEEEGAVLATEEFSEHSAPASSTTPDTTLPPESTEAISSNSDMEVQQIDTVMADSADVKKQSDSLPSTQTEPETVPDIEADALESGAETSLANKTTLTAAFTGDCWFKLTDARGKTVIADLKRADQRIEYSGLSPFHMVLGDATKVSLTLDGEIVDLSPFTSRNGRAELTLHAKAQSE